ncbi:class I SAM-dependent methyltransferase [Waterburya agarophytonicola K14]|uniref:Class I SAM-dependent methyltransferase n=1 Tax=Waterburya agarophytonicola KI4 TaxID=2874699 RepID=A0A964FFI9_9CYAN|nr:methyltransferase domain-containing protein [Waterburya agarophytonicola]MCC0177835.1 class I SAM-dependent methyltransferase [Waterburya agarophytonicola KI4]
MFEEQAKTLRDRVASLSQEAIAKKNPSGWFEPLYAEAGGDSEQVPWAKNQAHPYLQDWLAKYPSQTKGKSALVTGCGLGDDAEILASIGYRVTAFDISSSAIAWCKKRFPESTVDYQVGDLFALNSDWQNKFDLVYECRNIQALPLNVRSQVIKAIALTVAIKGTLLIITRHRDNDTIADGPPWALSDQELAQFVNLGLSEIRRDRFIESGIQQHRIEYSQLRDIPYLLDFGQTAK